MITVIKEYDGRWTVFNKRTKKSADIIRIEEHGFLKRKSPLYRVDVKGATVASMIENFQTAKSSAFRAVKET